MVALVRSRGLDLAGDTPADARAAIRELLRHEPTATRKVYAALAHKVWGLLIERRLDAEIRDWHGLLSGVKSWVRGSDEAAAERMTALADLLRESINLAETSPAREVAARPRARAILDLLNREDGYVSRGVLLDKLAIGSSHLSNVLTQLMAHNLIERREQGKQAEFALTPLGREIAGGDKPASRPQQVSPPADDAWQAVDMNLLEVLRQTTIATGVVVSASDFLGLHAGSHKDTFAPFLRPMKKMPWSPSAGEYEGQVAITHGAGPFFADRFFDHR